MIAKEQGPIEMLGVARGLSRKEGGGPRELGPVVAAFLGRQALESALRRYWASRRIALAGCSTRAQLACLSGYSEGRDIAALARQAWGELTRACHHHAYDLAPSWLEVEAALSAAEAVCRQVVSEGAEQ